MMTPAMPPTQKLAIATAVIITSLKMLSRERNHEPELRQF